MNMTLSIIVLTTLIFLLGCEQTGNKSKTIHAKNNSIQTTETQKKLTEEERQKQIEEENRIDSLRLDSALQDAFKIAQPAFKSDSFSKEYELRPNDSSYVINIEILIGNLFGDNQKYFLLRRRYTWLIHLDLYKIIDNKMKKLINREEARTVYIRDTIFDVNGDGYKDFLVHWYPASGCCKRDIYNVYLNQPNKNTFTKDYEFINPTFSAKEKIIRGLEYGHPGEAALYKYKWNGLHVDTVEFIYPDALTEGQFIKTKKVIYKPTKKDGIVLRAIPEEYQDIEK